MADALFLAVIAKEDLDKTIDTLNKGGSVAGRTIPLGTVVSLQGEEEDSALEVTYQHGDSKTKSETLTLAEASQRDELLGALTEALGPGWTEERRQKSRFLAILWPLGLLVGVALIGWLLYKDAQWIADGWQPQAGVKGGKAKAAVMAFHWLAGLLGPRGALIVAGILVGVCLLWLCAALASPPVQIAVRKNEETASGTGN
jgi:hypothetical protein